jgi:hypothetical protein
MTGSTRQRNAIAGAIGAGAVIAAAMAIAVPEIMH